MLVRLLGTTRRGDFACGMVAAAAVLCSGAVGFGSSGKHNVCTLHCHWSRIDCSAGVVCYVVDLLLPCLSTVARLVMP